MVVASMAAVIGGIVLLGSNATTWTQTEDALKKSEAMRAELIGQLDLRTVEGGPRQASLRWLALAAAAKIAKSHL